MDDADEVREGGAGGGDFRLGTIVQILSGAVGLGAYVALAGGVAVWVRTAAAGLSPSQALAATEPIALLASGYLILLVFPLTYAVVRVCLRVSGDIEASPRRPPAATAAVQGWRIGSQLVLAYFALIIALIPAVLVLGLVGLAATAGTSMAIAISGCAAAAVASLAWSLGRAVSRLTRRWTSLPEIRPLGKREAAVPPLLRYAVTRLLRSLRRYVVAASATTLACVAAMAAVVASDGPGWAYLAGFVVLWLSFTAATLALSGAVVLHFAVARDVGGIGAAEERARFSVFAVITLVVALFMLPISLGVLVVVMMLIALLADELPPQLLVRGAILSSALALGLMGLQARAPQRFDMLQLTAAGDVGPAPRSVRVAVIGTRGDAYLIAACDRVRSDVLEKHGWTSRHPVLLRLPKTDARDAVITRNAYAFLPRSEPSLGGAFLSTIDDALGFPALISSISLHPPSSADAIASDVCGGVNGAVQQARAAIRATAGG